jgi:hypothetical protein
MNQDNFPLGNNRNLAELEKAKSHIIVEIVQYVPNAVVSKTIIKKITGNITAMSFDTGKELSENHLPLIRMCKSLMAQHKLLSIKQNTF